MITTTQVITDAIGAQLSPSVYDLPVAVVVLLLAGGSSVIGVMSALAGISWCVRKMTAGVS
jgi:hypothetical protein